MNTRYYISFLFLLMYTVSLGQNTLLWKVTNANSKNISYIFGTYHLLGSGFIDSYPSIRERISASDIIITETKIDKIKAVEYYNSRPSSGTLSTILSIEDFDYIKQILRGGNVDLTKFTPGELFVKLQAFYPRFKCNTVKNNDTLLMDQYVQFLGNKDQKKLYFLETDSFQLEKITAATNPYDWVFFKKNITGLLKKYRDEKFDDNLCADADKYTSFNLDYKFNTKWSSNMKGVLGNTELVKKRNDDWLTKLPTLLEKSNCFVAVGLYHLYFDIGIIEQLRKLGYTVEEVKMK